MGNTVIFYATSNEQAFLSIETETAIKHFLKNNYFKKYFL